MKNETLKVDTTVGFLQDRQQVVNLSPLAHESSLGYVWRRVFLRKGPRTA